MERPNFKEGLRKVGRALPYIGVGLAVGGLTWGVWWAAGHLGEPEDTGSKDSVPITAYCEGPYSILKVDLRRYSPSAKSELFLLIYRIGTNEPPTEQGIRNFWENRVSSADGAYLSGDRLRIGIAEEIPDVGPPLLVTNPIEVTAAIC